MWHNLYVLDYSDYSATLRQIVRKESFENRFPGEYLDFHYEYCIARAIRDLTGAIVVNNFLAQGFEPCSDIIYDKHKSMILGSVDYMLKTARIVLQRGDKIKMMTASAIVLLAQEKETF